MAAKKPPAFQFYAAEFLVDENVVLMSNQAVGCYIKLMAYCWREGSVPADIEKIAKLCGEDGNAMNLLWQSIGKCFSVAIDDASRLIHPRLEQEREKQAEHRKARAAAGAKGAKAKWDKAEQVDGNAMFLPMEKNGSSSSTSSSLTPHTPRAPAEISIILRRYTINANPAHPSVIALAEQGIDLETLEACCKETREAKPNETISIGYIVKKLEGWKQQAAQVNVVGAKAKKADTWFLSAAAMSAKAKELGIPDARLGETEPAFKARIQQAINGRSAAA